MTNIGSLVADLRLESAAFQRNLNKAARNLQSNSAKMRQSMKRVETATKNLNRQFAKLRTGVGALAGALAVRQFTNFTRAAIEAGDEIAKTARAVGVAAQAFQELRLAANLAGASSEQFTSGLGAFAKRVGELKAETGALSTLLNRTNTSLRDQLVAAQSTEMALAIFLDTLGGIDNAQERLALSSAAFGRTAGVAFANFAGASEDALALIREVGLVMESDVLGAAERLQDEITLLETAFSTGFNSAIIRDLAGNVDATADGLRHAKLVGEQFGQLVGRSMRALADAAAFVGRNLREIVTALVALIALKAASVIFDIVVAMRALVIAAARGAKALFLASLATRANIKGLLVMAGTIVAATAAWETFADGIGGELTSLINDATSAMSDFTTASVDGVGEANDSVADFIRTLTDQRDVARALTRAQKEGAAALELVNTAQEIHNAQLQLGVVFTDQQRRAVTELIEERNEAERQQQRIIDQQADAARAVEEAAEAQARAQEEMQEDLRRRAEENERLFQEPFINAVSAIQSEFSRPFVEFEPGVVDDPRFRSQASAMLQEVFL